MIAIVTTASSGQEDAVSITCGEQFAVQPIPCRPCNSSVVVQFLEFRFSRHSPIITPINCGSVVLGQQGCQVVGKAVIAVTGIITVLGKGVVIAIAILVCAPIVGNLGLRLAPGEVVSIVFRVVGTNVARGP